MRSIRLFSLLISLGSGWAIGQYDDAKALIHQVVVNYQSAKTLHLESVSENALSGELHRSWSKTRTTLAKDGPERVRWETTAMGGSYLVVADGETAWIASPDSREFIRVKWTGPVSELKGGGPVAESSVRALKFAMGEIERLEANIRRAVVTGKEEVELNGKPVQCLVLRADYDPPKTATGVESVTRTFWIDPRRRLILREEVVTQGKLFPALPYEQVESKHTKRYTVATVNEPVPAALFAYDPPRTFREVDRLERAFSRPAADLNGKPAPELSLQSLTGETVSLSQFRGKIILLDFWAAWCAPCRTQLPALARLHRESKDQGVVLLGINDDESPEIALKYLRENGYDWQNLFDGTQKDARAKFKVAGIPALVVIDQQGVIVEYQVGSGETSEQAVRVALQKLGVKLP